MRNFMFGSCLASTFRLLVFAGLYASCFPALASDGLLSPAQQKAARKIYVAKCAKCHEFKDPRTYKGPEWDKWMNSMSRKSKLKQDQDALLRRYLDDYRKGTIRKID